MEMPRPGEAHKRLEKLVGSWIGEEVMQPSPWAPEGGTATGRVTNRMALDGFNIIQDYEQERNGVVTFRGHGIFSWDAMRHDYVLHWFDSMGMPPNEFRGDFDGDVLTLNSRGPQGHSRGIHDFTRPGSYTFKMDMSQDGSQWQNFMEATYQRGE